jgi:hypothetical protein
MKSALMAENWSLRGLSPAVVVATERTVRLISDFVNIALAIGVTDQNITNVIAPAKNTDQCLAKEISGY